MEKLLDDRAALAIPPRLVAEDHRLGLLRHIHQVEIPLEIVERRLGGERGNGFAGDGADNQPAGGPIGVALQMRGAQFSLAEPAQQFITGAVLADA